ncbi:MAG TPA: glycoside hydrolase family 130 protein [Armatimonadota bacterium]|nr:glycoside hydrolase family 130 protein [Armatimonadota bacterium]
MSENQDRYQGIPAYIGNGLLKRYHDNPIITAEDIPGGAACVFNSGFAAYEDKTVGLIHAWDREWVPRFFIGWSDDGIHFEIEPKNVIVPPDEYPYVPHEGIFDARITPLDGVYYITYNVASRLGGRIMLARTDDFKSIETIGFIAGPDHRNCALFPEKIKGDYVRLERPQGVSEGDIYIGYSPDMIHWGRTKLLLEKYHRYWESIKVGPAAPPVKTDKGWLTVYHGCRKGMNGYIYMMGCMLLDLEDPSRIIGKINEPVMSPEEYYERVGIVGNVVFPTAAIPRGEDELWVYYGAADTCIGLAFGSVSELVDLCLKNPFPGQKPCR